MGRYLLGRLLQAIPVLIGITVLVFLLIHLVPGDPARNILGPRATPEAIAELRAQHGLDRSLPEQYRLFASQLARGDLGDSLFFRRPVAALLGDRLAVSAWLVGAGVLLSLLIAVPLGLLAALREDRAADHAVRAFGLLALGMPSVWVGLMLVLIFGVSLGVLPVGGFGDGVLGHTESVLLPGLTIALAVAPLLIRSIRASVLDILHADFVIAARAKGLPRGAVLRRHVLPNAIIPTLTILSVQIAVLLGGTIVVESVFGLPGIGQLLVQSISEHDFAVVQGVTLMLAVAVLVVGVLTDVLCAALDPRVRLDR
jgi:peptide/nickel transport system permease protein